MQGNFIFHNPTKIYFGPDSIKNLTHELKKYKNKILLIYGKNSIKVNGLYDQVITILKQNRKQVCEISGVMSNPTLDKLNSGLKISRKFKPDLILAIGGGSVIDYAKAISVCTYSKCNIWDNYWVKANEPSQSVRIIPVGTILTMSGTGSEMNGGSVITNTKTKQKIGKHFGSNVFPKFSILNPNNTLTVPYKQMVSGIFDIFAHLSEQYFSDFDNNTTDYIIEGLMRSVIENSLKATKNPNDYEARSNLMWASTWSLNTLCRKGKTEDWTPHKIGQCIGAVTNATHGLTLSAIYIAYHKTVMPYAIDKYVKFATNVWKIKQIKSKKQIALLGIKALAKWMKQLGVNVSLNELGFKPNMINSVLKNVAIQKGCYKKLTKADIKDILIKSLKHN